jgi:hypothetical protein
MIKDVSIHWELVVRRLVLAKHANKLVQPLLSKDSDRSAYFLSLSNGGTTHLYARIGKTVTSPEHDHFSIVNLAISQYGSLHMSRWIQ